MSNDLFSHGKKVYVAAPYTAPTEVDRENNVYKACSVGRKVMALGFSPFVPTLSHFIDPKNDKFPYERWMDWCLQWLKDCDVLLVTGLSKGVRIEIDFAIKNAIPIVWSLDQLEWRHEQELLRTQSRQEDAGGDQTAEGSVRDLQDQEPESQEEAEVGRAYRVDDIRTVGPHCFKRPTVPFCPAVFYQKIFRRF